MFKRIGTMLAIVSSATALNAQKPLEPPQGLNDSARVLYKQLVELMPRVRAAESAFRRSDAEKERASVEPLDTMAVGPYLVIAPDKESAIAFAAFTEAFAGRRHVLAGVTAPVTTLLIEVERPVPIFRFMQRAPRTRTTSLMGRDKKERKRILTRLIDESLIDFVPDSVRSWLTDGLQRVQPRLLAYREVAIGSSKVTQQCIAGNHGSCLDALGLGDTTRTNWYTPAQVRAIAMASSGYRYNSFEKKQCARSADITACLKSISMWGGLPAPVTSSVRGDFFNYVVERGGRGAVARLRAGGTPAAALSAAGNAPLDILVKDWLADLREAAGSIRRTNASVGLTTLFWSGVLLLFAMRSTRRRTR